VREPNRTLLIIRTAGYLGTRRFGAPGRWHLLSNSELHALVSCDRLGLEPNGDRLPTPTAGRRAPLDRYEKPWFHDVRVSRHRARPSETTRYLLSPRRLRRPLG
jgi:hypothetical protein